MLLETTSKYNFYDYFIMLIIASTVIGTAQIGLISHAFVVGLLCLPLTLLEIVSSFKKGKMQPIILFITIWIVYALLSVTWAPKHEYLLREIWKLSWNIVIFIGLYHASRKANSIQQSFMTGWRILVCLTLLIAAWEIATDSHLAGIGDFNENAEIVTADGGYEHRIFAAVTYMNLNSYVTLLCMALPFLVYGTSILQKKWISILAIIGSCCVLFVNASRGGLMCLAIDCIILIIFYRKFHFSNKRIITLFMIIALILFIFLFGLSIASQAIGRLSAYGAEDIMSDAGRWDVWRMGVEFCIDSCGFGCGVGSMQPMYASTGFWLHHSHNFVIEFILQYGIWLFIPFGLMLWKNWQRMIKANNISQNILGWMLLLSFVPLAIIDDTYLTRTFMWLWLITQFAIANSLETTKK